MTPAPVVKKRNYRPDIEGLRGVAVCLVIAFHSSPQRFQGGFIGVDVFFVISGYLITGLLVREIEETGRLSLGGFYARRARRLLPASALVLLATILACRLFLSPMQEYHLGNSETYTALYISNFWFLRQATDYFAPAIANNPFLHTWSLAVEEQFYLVWPVIVLLGLRGRRPRRTLLAIMMLIAAASFTASVWFTRTLEPLAFFSPSTRAWEFAIGGLALLLGPLALRVSEKWRALAGWLGLASILAAALFQVEAGWPGWHALIPVLGSAAVLQGFVPQVGVSRVLELPVAQWIGRLSYVWYLWHWPVLAITRAMPGGLDVYGVVLCAAASLGLAMATHALVENPIRFSRYLAPRRAFSLACAGLVTVATAGTAIMAQNAATREAHSLERGKMFAALKDPDQQRSACPPVDLLGTDVSVCIGGNPASTLTVVLFGDSHARQWFPAFEAIANDSGWRVVLISKPACPTARLTIFSHFLNRPYTECNIWREAAIRRIIDIRPAAVVVANDQLQSFSSGLNGPDETWREATRSTLETFDSAAIETILLRDTPSPGFDVPDCLTGDSSWWARKHALANNPCVLDRAEALNDGIFRAEQQAAEGLHHVHVLDLSDLFCDDAVCPPVKNGFVVYRDDSHISASFARSLAPTAGSRLEHLISYPGLLRKAQ